MKVNRKNVENWKIVLFMEFLIVLVIILFLLTKDNKNNKDE